MTSQASNLEEAAVETRVLPVALVVDGDAVSRRFVELALGDSGGFAVESTKDAASAYELLKTQLVDLVVSESDLPDMNGLRFFRQLGQEQRLRDVPFLFLSSDKRAETKIAAFKAGADEYLTKPCELFEFRARASALVTRRFRTREVSRRRSYLLAGDFEAISFPDIVSIIGMARRSGVLSVVTPRGTGQVFFDSGRVVHAVFGSLVGPEAFYRFVREPAGQFELAPGEPSLGADLQTIHVSTTALVMEAARLQDEAARPRVDGEDGEDGDDRSPVTALQAALMVDASTVRPTAHVRALAPDSMLAAQFELGLRDPFALGELRLWTEEELSRWTIADGGSARLHVHLVADPAAGVSAVLGLAGSPTERWVLGSLSPHKKAFGLTYFMRHERTVDVVLIDANDPSAFQSSLLRSPSVLIVAPPEGDFMSMGIHSRVALEGLVRQLDPAAIVGVGSASLDMALRRMELDRGRMLRCTQGVLGEGESDLRSLLIKGVRLWSASGEQPTWRPKG